MGALDGHVGVSQPSIADEVSGVTAKVDGAGNLAVSGVFSPGHIKLEPLGDEQVVVSDPAVGLTPPAGATLALIQNDADGAGRVIRWRDFGVDPTAALGIRLPGGGQFEYGGNLSVIKFFKESGGDILMNVSYYKDA